MQNINEDLIKVVCNTLAVTLISKNKDYGNSVQDQFREYGMTSLLIRLDDKLKRLKNLQKNEQLVMDESILDTLQDLAGYAVLGHLCLNIENAEKETQKAVDLG
jgi:Nucleotide modification associated domain 1